MLKKILSVSGKSGLFKMVSQGKNMLIAESLIDQKRIPVYPRDKVVSLGDIRIYTDDEEVPLSQIFNTIKEKENSQPIDFNPTIKPDELKSYFAEILPNFDRERVYPSDIKKIMNWYNLLINTGNTDFEKEEESEQESEKTEEQETKKEE
ncbi:hypothetical protein FACS189451_03640 [Bacteroidia bacterium]|nr:hypothetical protein FACS189451_03640 [Bacteroidia bacterium]GHU79355.1 hypothetical protein FACS1894145_3320 [Bacteroidia bacterium]